jgi:hypothetical protein
MPPTTQKNYIPFEPEMEAKLIESKFENSIEGFSRLSQTYVVLGPTSHGFMNTNFVEKIHDLETRMGIRNTKKKKVSKKRQMPKPSKKLSEPKRPVRSNSIDYLEL